MKKSGMHRTIFFAPCLLLLIACSCHNAAGKSEFIGSYKIGKIVPRDSSTIDKAKRAEDWILSLEDKNNFRLYGSGKNIVGYWNIEKDEGKQYQLTLQGGGSTVQARFDGTTIYFERPDKMLDSLFSQAVFTRTAK